MNNNATRGIDSLADGEKRGVSVDGSPDDPLKTITGQIERLGQDGSRFRVLISIGSRSIELNDVQSGTLLGAILQAASVRLRDAGQ